MNPINSCTSIRHKPRSIRDTMKPCKTLYNQSRQARVITIKLKLNTSKVIENNSIRRKPSLSSFWISGSLDNNDSNTVMYGETIREEV